MPTCPSDLAEVIALHREMFGGYVMEADDDDGADGADGAQGAQSTLNEHGFPDKTPVKDMAIEQQAAYWRHQSRKHEDRVRGMSDYETLKAERDELKSRTQTADEKAIEAAKAEAATAASSAERARLAPKLVGAEFRAVSAGRLDATKLAEVLDGLDHTKFLTPEGDADTDKVKRYVEAFAPIGDKKRPDMGQGSRLSQKSTGVDAGRALFADRRPSK